MFVPSRDEFIRLSATGNLIPVYREILADRLTPVSAFERLGAKSGAFLLESVEGGERAARYSFLGRDPFLVFRAHNGVVTVTEDGVSRDIPISEGHDALHVLQEVMGRFQLVPVPGLPRFCGGAVGFLAYDMVRQFEKIETSTVDDLGVDDCCFQFTDTVLVFDHVLHRVKVVSNARVGDDPGAAYDRAIERIDALIADLRHPIEYPEVRHEPAPHLSVESNVTPEQYEGFVSRCKEYIAAGDAFQVVPSVRFTTKLSVAPFEVYRALRSLNPSPYLYYLDFGDSQVVGSSPEILATKEGDRAVVRPIAGTRPRGKTPEEDERLERELLADEKERAEHIMLVDLGRNDIGRIAKYGTVRVEDLMVIERYSHVMHIVSSVSGTVADGQTSYDVMRAAFPAGTLTGAPKVRAMEIIEELEPNRRGLYGGAVGYFSFSGDMDFAIAIRTMLVKNGLAYIQAGAGVVADSVPASEFNECRNKARAAFTAIEMATAGLE